MPARKRRATAARARTRASAGPRRSPRAPRPPRTRTRDASAREAARAIRALVGGLRRVSDASAAALNNLHLIKEAAVVAHEERLVRALAEDRVLADLAALDAALSAADPGAANPELARLRAVPAAALRWACESLHLEPMLEPGDEREVPAESLDKFDWTGAPPPAGAALVRLSVVASGFRWRGEVVVKPRVEPCP